MKELVIISKKWDKPEISMVVTNEEVSFCMTLSDFINCFKWEMKSENGINEKMDAAFNRVLHGIKSESSRVMR